MLTPKESWGSELLFWCLKVRELALSKARKQGLELEASALRKKVKGNKVHEEMRSVLLVLGLRWDTYNQNYTFGHCESSLLWFNRSLLIP